MSKSAKYSWHFHNEQGAFLATVESVSVAGAWKKFRKEWSGKAICTQGHQAEA